MKIQKQKRQSGDGAQMPKPTVVFTEGVFDLFHANHVAFLRQASTFGDRLLVGIFSDKAVEQYKHTPIMTQDERLSAVRTQACVDEAFIIDSMAEAPVMKKLIAEHAISIVVYAGNSTPDFYRPAEQAGIMRRIPYRDGISSTRLIERIIERYKASLRSDLQRN
jgi:glycerol-3-phosphate cytidylyltransferase